ncbi:MAG: DinB family protein [Desulfosporosinus sp.]|nr:DinB family protein [Desulfosporosinus sp.]
MNKSQIIDLYSYNDWANKKLLISVSHLELWKQMLHVTNHSTFHRGQTVTMLRQLKKIPPSLDLFYYYLGER